MKSKTLAIWVAVYFILDALSSVYLIGRPRESVTFGQAVFNVLSDTVLAFAVYRLYKATTEGSTHHE